jgi:cytochrome c-type biogenesis protein CcmH/NrfG
VISIRLVVAICLICCIRTLIPPAAADTYEVILKGKVVMGDGSPLPSGIGIYRHCNDVQGSAPGPLAGKKGDFIWHMNADSMATRACTVEATLEGYSSTTIDISNFDGFTKKVYELPPLVLSKRGADPRVVKNGNDDVPVAAHAEWKAAMKAGDANDYPEFVAHLKAVVAAAPAFARGWHTLGIAYEVLQMPADARDAYTHAIQVDPKMVASWVTLSRMDVLVKDWPGAETAAKGAIKLDPRRAFPEVYLHQAVARYELKDFAGAETSVREALGQRGKETSRAEFVLGRILDAKGDYAGAREHIAKFLAENPKAPDAELVKGYMDLIGKPEAAGINPDLELP